MEDQQEREKDDLNENCREVPSTEDVEANANISPEVELVNSSSNGNKTRYTEKDKFPSEDEERTQNEKAKVGRPHKGTIIASRRSAHAQAHAREE